MEMVNPSPVPAKRTGFDVTVVAHQELPPAPQALQLLARLGRSGLLAAPPVALPDLHLKPMLETPSSTATATLNTLILGLTSPSPNCSMALARTTFHIDDIDDRAIDKLFSELIQHLTLSRRKQVLCPAEVADVMLRGAEASIERYGLDPSTLGFMDQNGNALPRDVDPRAVVRAVPQMLREIGGWEFALVGKGNHFLELQVVEQIHDQAVAQAWGVEKGQLVVMYHADSGHVGAFIGRLYAHRRKNTWRGRLFEWRVKFPFLLRTGQLKRLLHRVNYHVIPRRLTPIPADSDEGQRTLLALQAAGNYAYANRLAVLAALRDGMRAVWGKSSAPPALLWDAPHNGIRREIIEGQALWVHRHNAARAEPPSQASPHSPFAGTGHPVLLPGVERTSSYLCVASEGAIHTLNSVSHGAGCSALHMGRPLDNSFSTRVYCYENGLHEIRPHLSDNGLEKVIVSLEANDIAHPVARLRPLAVLKDRT